MAPWNFPATWWLDAFDIGLGLLCLIPLLIVLGAMFQDIAESLRNRFSARRLVRDTHAFEVPGLGMTMADGGEPAPVAKDRERKTTK